MNHKSPYTSAEEFAVILSRAKGSKKSADILLIEDDPIYRELVKFVLQDYNCVLTEAEDGEHGIQCIESKKFSLVILNLKLPLLDGVEILRRKGTELNHTPILILTGVEHVNLREVIQGNCWMVSFLSKPNKLEDLKAYFALMLGTYRKVK